MLTLEEELRGEGGALAIEDGSFSLIKGQMMVDSCMAKMGGGIYLARSHLAQSGGNLTIKDCKAENGGGLALHESPMILSEGGRLSSKKCIAANSGGGAWVNSGDVIQQGGTLAFEDCEAKQFGGGMYIKGHISQLDGRMLLDRCKVQSNQSFQQLSEAESHQSNDKPSWGFGGPMLQKDAESESDKNKLSWSFGSSDLQKDAESESDKSELSWDFAPILQKDADLESDKSKLGWGSGSPTLQKYAESDSDRHTLGGGGVWVQSGKIYQKDGSMSFVGCYSEGVGGGLGVVAGSIQQHGGIVQFGDCAARRSGGGIRQYLADGWDFEVLQVLWTDDVCQLRSHTEWRCATSVTRQTLQLAYAILRDISIFLIAYRGGRQAAAKISSILLNQLLAFGTVANIAAVASLNTKAAQDVKEYVGEVVSDLLQRFLLEFQWSPGESSGSMSTQCLLTYLHLPPEMWTAHVLASVVPVTLITIAAFAHDDPFLALIVGSNCFLPAFCANFAKYVVFFRTEILETTASKSLMPAAAEKREELGEPRFEFMPDTLRQWPVWSSMWFCASVRWAPALRHAQDERLLLLDCFLAWSQCHKLRPQQATSVRDATAQASEDERPPFLFSEDLQVPSRRCAGVGSVPPVLPNHTIRALAGEEVFLEANGSLRGASLLLSQRPPKATRDFLQSYDICLPWVDLQQRPSVHGRPWVHVRRISKPLEAMKLLIAAALALVLAAGDHQVLLPKDATSRKMLVMLPGGKVPNEHYLATGAAIQEAMAQKGSDLWVVIPSVFQNLCMISCPGKFFCSPLHGVVETALSMAARAGWQRDPQDDLWLSGHSLGSTCANMLFQAYNKGPSPPYAGLIVMGGYVDEAGEFDLIHYPVPVLSLNVELDGGLARPGKISTWWRQFLTLRSSGDPVRSKPVIVLPQLNHSNFCPGFDVPGDLMAEVPQEEATSVIASSVSAFLVLHDSKTSSQIAQRALELLQQQVEWTEKLMTPYLKAQSWERNENHSVSSEGSSPFCALAQRVLSGLQAEDEAKLEVLDGFHISSPNLEHCHPNWTQASQGLTVRSCSHTNYYPDLSNTGKITAALEIGCKMVSATRIEEKLKVQALEDHLPCKEMNKRAVQLAEELAFSSTLRRYNAHGRSWCFLDDSPSVAGPVWVFKDRLLLKENKTCMSVQSPAMLTELNALICPGIHYCKLLSPARVLDWMMTDSLKPGAREELELIV
eukprot:g8556.t1